ncbi:MAG: septal ring lytic transglycosylase RlpA family protein [Xanthomonadales bacterium]|nr:septal ring lytic transglycosylase RlpA family protein [Xanthomonadales bacterium]
MAGSGRLILLLAVTLLAGCAGKGKPRPGSAGIAPQPGAGGVATAVQGADPCAQIYEHDEADYTAGGLYRPGQRDHAPTGRPDLDRIAEPVPRAEPLSRYGNRPVYTVLGREYRVLSDVRNYRERGLASWYGAKFHGRATSSMEPYDMCAFTAAHKTLPLPSYARVTHLGNGRSVVVRVNDRGPFHDGRIIDLSYVAALKLGVYETGTALVEVEAIAPDGPVLLPAPAAGPTTVWLQLGAFGERANAQALVSRLRQSGESARLVEPDAGQPPLYRVHAGPFTAAAVEEAKARLRLLGLPATPIVIGN